MLVGQLSGPNRAFTSFDSFEQAFGATKIYVPDAWVIGWNTYWDKHDLNRAISLTNSLAVIQHDQREQNQPQTPVFIVAAEETPELRAIEEVGLLTFTLVPKESALSQLDEALA